MFLALISQTRENGGRKGQSLDRILRILCFTYDMISLDTYDKFVCDYAVYINYRNTWLFEM